MNRKMFSIGNSLNQFKGPGPSSSKLSKICINKNAHKLTNHDDRIGGITVFNICPPVLIRNIVL